MIIVLFHVIYLLGKLAYRRYNSSAKTATNNEIVEQQSLIREIDFGEDFNDIWSNAMSNSSRLQRRNSNSDDDYEESKSTIKFSPPAYIQRYQAVSNILTQYHGKLQKIVEFGCAELAFCIYLKNMPGVEEVLFVDIDRVTLEMYKKRAKPLHVDYLHRRSRPLVIKILEGSITQPDELLENCDAVVCIELVEHLYPEPLTTLPYNLFGFIKPQVVIITTPNAEFNVLFTNLKGFRHPDHKFEWTRSQFEDWAHNITTRFPEYTVTFHGICNGPSGTEHLGACSQMAVFHKSINLNQVKVCSVRGLYKVVEVYEFPYEIDNRSDEQKILDDATYFIRKFSYDSDGEFQEELPLQKVLNVLSKFYISMEQLKDILINSNFNVVDKEDGPVILIPPESFSDSFSVHDIVEDEFLENDPGQYGWGLENRGQPIEYAYYDQSLNVFVNEESWDSDPDIIEPIEILRSNDTNNLIAEAANSTASIYPDDMCLDDIVIESRSTELANSRNDVSVTISSFSESKESENSLDSYQQADLATSSSTENNHADLNKSISFFHVADKISSDEKSEDLSSTCKNVSMCSMYLEPSELSLDITEPSLYSTVTNIENYTYEEFKSSAGFCGNNSHENTFEKPNFTSSPHVFTANYDKKKINQTIEQPSSNSTFNNDESLYYSNDDIKCDGEKMLNESVIGDNNLR